MPENEPLGLFTEDRSDAVRVIQASRGQTGSSPVEQAPSLESGHPLRI